jgi:glycosyltransferase involved in cell wall biosynthesis
MQSKKSLTIVVPIYNEKDNLVPLYGEFNELKKKLPFSLEIIFVDDGSNDGSNQLSRNFGQSAALDAGIKQASGEVIATMDADLQNDPLDIPRLMQILSQEYDVVVGWRKERRDPPEKRIFSLLANFLRRKLTGETIHDSGCTLRLYKKEALADLDLYGEMHRFIPAILSWRGYKIAEAEVHHRKRLSGKSKYGTARLIKGFLDLLFVVFLLRYSSRPFHIFGSMGLVIFSLGFIIGGYLSFIKLFYAATLSNRPLLILGVLLMVLGVQFFVFGIMAEILIRIYFKVHSLRPYIIHK